MAKQRTFKAVFEHEDKGWTVTIPAVKGCFTWGRSLSAARTNIREALAVCVDVLGADAESIAENATIEEEIRLPAKVKAELVRLEARRAAAADAELAAMMATRNATRAVIKELGVSLRDAAVLVGLSHQRLHQLVDAMKGATR